MTTNLEDDLRAHYGAKSAELNLTPLEFSDLRDRNEGPTASVLPMPPIPSSRRGSTWMVAAALVAGSAIGAGAILVTRDDTSTGRNEVRSEIPAGLPDVGAATGWCDDADVPQNVAELGLPNDVRVPGELLPAATPAGHCVGDHYATTNPRSGGYTVWSSCVECDRPTAAVARVHDLPDYDAEGDLPYESVSVGRRDARFYSPGDNNPVARLYVESGEGWVLFAGWGLEAAQFAEFAEGVFGQSGAPEDVDDMVLVFDGVMGQYMPSNVPVFGTLGVWYFDDTGNSLGYQVVHRVYIDPTYTPPLEAYAWALPDPVFAEVDGQRTVSFPASNWYNEQQQTVLITQVDDDTQVIWTSHGADPLPADELAAIELTPAAPDDPRWLEIAYESGAYDAVG